MRKTKITSNSYGKCYCLCVCCVYKMLWIIIPLKYSTFFYYIKILISRTPSISPLISIFNNFSKTEKLFTNIICKYLLKCTLYKLELKTRLTLSSQICIKYTWRSHSHLKEKLCFHTTETETIFFPCIFIDMCSVRATPAAPADNADLISQSTIVSTFMDT